MKFRKDPKELDIFSQAIQPYLVQIMRPIYQHKEDPDVNYPEKVMKVISLFRHRAVFEESFLSQIESDIHTKNLPCILCL